MKTVVVFVSGGFVQDVVSDDPDIRVIVSDLDCEEFGDGDPWQSEREVFHVADLSTIPEPGDRVRLSNGGWVNVWQLAGAGAGTYEVIDDDGNNRFVDRGRSTTSPAGENWYEVDRHA